jgi:hypothetical protein
MTLHAIVPATNTVARTKNFPNAPISPVCCGSIKPTRTIATEIAASRVISATGQAKRIIRARAARLAPTPTKLARSRISKTEWITLPDNSRGRAHDPINVTIMAAVPIGVPFALPKMMNSGSKEYCRMIMMPIESRARTAPRLKPARYTLGTRY